MKPLRLIPLVAAIAAVLSAPVQAENLVELYQLARGFDASYQSAKAQFDATLARGEQARAGILPAAGLALGVSRSTQNVVPELGASSDRSYGTQSASLSASQPLYRPANWISYQQGLKQLDLAQSQLAGAEQDLIVRVGQSYFDVLSASDNVTFVQAQKKAVAEQLAAAKRNFEVGTSTITDTREAQARFDLVLAQEIAADNDLRVKKLALDQLVGKSNIQPNTLVPGLHLPELLPADVNHWTAQSESAHPLLAQSRIALELAQLETKKAQAGNKPTLDLTANYSVINNQEGSSSVAMGSRVNVGTLGLSFNLPLFAGYAVQNRIKETLALESKARSDLDQAQRGIAQGTRSAFFGVLSGYGQVKALEAAEASSQSALEANQLGYQVGVRINIDVLNAQSQLYDTKAKLAKARYDVLLGGLKLRQANGTLKADDLAAVNALLVPQ